MIRTTTWTNFLITKSDTSLRRTERSYTRGFIFYHFLRFKSFKHKKKMNYIAHPFNNYFYYLLIFKVLTTLKAIITKSETLPVLFLFY